MSKDTQLSVQYREFVVNTVSFADSEQCTGRQVVNHFLSDDFTVTRDSDNATSAVMFVLKCYFEALNALVIVGKEVFTVEHL